MNNDFVWHFNNYQNKNEPVIVDVVEDDASAAARDETCGGTLEGNAADDPKLFSVKIESETHKLLLLLTFRYAKLQVSGERSSASSYCLCYSVRRQLKPTLIL